MLDQKRLKEAETNIKSYLNEGLIKKTRAIDTNILNVYRKNSKESLEVADHLFKNNMSALWIIVCSYYSMYYSANAMLYKYGYKIGHRISHKITADALIVFIRKRLKDSLIEDYREAEEEALQLAGLKADEIIESFDYERTKRSTFQYQMAEPLKKSKAETSLIRAKNFVFEMEKILAG